MSDDKGAFMNELPPSLWARTAIAGPDCPPLAGHEAADVVIVGAGYTGCSAALHLAREGKEVRVLDTAEPGWGCSGRNGGQVNPGGQRATPEEVIDVLGDDWGNRFNQMGHATCDLVFDLIKAYDIECEAVRPGYIQGGWNQQGLKYQQEWADQWRARGVEIELLNGQQMMDLIGSEHYSHGMYDSRGGNVQPMSYARGLAHAAIVEGAVIHGRSPAIGIEKDGSDWVVVVEGARSIKAKYLIIATNGYTGDLWSGLKQTVVPVSSFVAATQPLGHNLLATILPGKHAVSESGRVIVYYRLDQKGRLIIGGHGNFLNINQIGDNTHVREIATRLFPALSDVKWDYHWGGWPAITKTHLPMLVGLAPNAFSGLGYNGRGVAMGTMMGKQLSKAILDDSADLRVQSLDKFTFHGMRQLGITYRLVVGSWLDGRPPAKSA